jgi:hypothetical protein
MEAAKTILDQFEIVKVFEGVYCDRLQDFFTGVTGMNTHLIHIYKGKKNEQSKQCPY